MQKKVSEIPCGEYCYDKNKICPYWHDVTIKDNGCDLCFMTYGYGKSCNARIEPTVCVGIGCGKHVAMCSYCNCTQTEHEGILWDKVKICHINLNSKDDSL